MSRPNAESTSNKKLTNAQLEEIIKILKNEKVSGNESNPVSVNNARKNITGIIGENASTDIRENPLTDIEALNEFLKKPEVTKSPSTNRGFIGLKNHATPEKIKSALQACEEKLKKNYLSLDDPSYVRDTIDKLKGIKAKNQHEFEREIKDFKEKLKKAYVDVDPYEIFPSKLRQGSKESVAFVEAVKKFALGNENDLEDFSKQVQNYNNSLAKKEAKEKGKILADANLLIAEALRRVAISDQNSKIQRSPNSILGYKTYNENKSKNRSGDFKELADNLQTFEEDKVFVYEDYFSKSALAKLRGFRNNPKALEEITKSAIEAYKKEAKEATEVPEGHADLKKFNPLLYKISKLSIFRETTTEQVQTGSDLESTLNNKAAKAKQDSHRKYNGATTTGVGSGEPSDGEGSELSFGANDSEVSDDEMDSEEGLYKRSLLENLTINIGTLMESNAGLIRSNRNLSSLISQISQDVTNLTLESEVNTNEVLSLIQSLRDDYQNLLVHQSSKFSEEESKNLKGLIEKFNALDDSLNSIKSVLASQKSYFEELSKKYENSSELKRILDNQDLLTKTLANQGKAASEAEARLMKAIEALKASIESNQANHASSVSGNGASDAENELPNYSSMHRANENLLKSFDFNQPNTPSGQENTTNGNFNNGGGQNTPFGQGFQNQPAGNGATINNYNNNYNNSDPSAQNVQNIEELIKEVKKAFEDFKEEFEQKIKEEDLQSQASDEEIVPNSEGRADANIDLLLQKIDDVEQRSIQRSIQRDAATNAAIAAAHAAELKAIKEEKAAVEAKNEELQKQIKSRPIEQFDSQQPKLVSSLDLSRSGKNKGIADINGVKRDLLIPEISGRVARFKENSHQSLELHESGLVVAVYNMGAEGATYLERDIIAAKAKSSERKTATMLVKIINPKGIENSEEEIFCAISSSPEYGVSTSYISRADFEAKVQEADAEYQKALDSTANIENFKKDFEILSKYQKNSEEVIKKAISDAENALDPESTSLEEKEDNKKAALDILDKYHREVDKIQKDFDGRYNAYESQKGFNTEEDALFDGLLKNLQKEAGSDKKSSEKKIQELIKNDELDQNLSEAESKIEQVEKALKEDEEKLAQSQEELKTIEKTLEKQNERKIELQDCIAKNKQKLENIGKELIELNGFKAEAEENLKQLEKEAKEAAAKESEAKADLDNFTTGVAAYKKTQTFLKEIEEETEAINKIQEDLARLETDKAQAIEKLNKKFQDASEEVKKLEKDLENKKEAKNQDIDQKKAELEKLKLKLNDQKYESFTQKINGLEAEILTFVGNANPISIAQTESLKTQIVIYNQSLERLGEGTAEKEFCDLRKSIKAKNEEIEKVRANHENAIQKSSEELNKGKAEQKKIEEELRQGQLLFSKQERELKSQKQEKETAIASKQEKINGLNESVESAKNILETHKKEGSAQQEEGSAPIDLSNDQAVKEIEEKLVKQYEDVQASLAEKTYLVRESEDDFQNLCNLLIPDAIRQQTKKNEEQQEDEKELKDVVEAIDCATKSQNNLETAIAELKNQIHLKKEKAKELNAEKLKIVVAQATHRKEVEVVLAKQESDKLNELKASINKVKNDGLNTKIDDLSAKYDEENCKKNTPSAAKEFSDALNAFNDYVSKSQIKDQDLLTALEDFNKTCSKNAFRQSRIASDKAKYLAKKRKDFDEADADKATLINELKKEDELSKKKAISDKNLEARLKIAEALKDDKKDAEFADEFLQDSLAKINYPKEGLSPDKIFESDRARLQNYFPTRSKALSSLNDFAKGEDFKELDEYTKKDAALKLLEKYKSRIEELDGLVSDDDDLESVASDNGSDRQASDAKKQLIKECKDEFARLKLFGKTEDIFDIEDALERPDNYFEGFTPSASSPEACLEAREAVLRIKESGSKRPSLENLSDEQKETARKIGANEFARKSADNFERAASIKLDFNDFEKEAIKVELAKLHKNKSIFVGSKSVRRNSDDIDDFLAESVMPSGVHLGPEVRRPNRRDDIATVLFRGTDRGPNGERGEYNGDDIMYLHIRGTLAPNALYVKVQLSTADNNHVTSYKDGKAFLKNCNFGDIVIDESTVFTKDNSGEYLARGVSALEQHQKDLYKHMKVKAMSAIDSQRKTAILFDGESVAPKTELTNVENVQEELVHDLSKSDIEGLKFVTRLIPYKKGENKAVSDGKIYIEDSRNLENKILYEVKSDAESLEDINKEFPSLKINRDVWLKLHEKLPKPKTVFEKPVAQAFGAASRSRFSAGISG